MDETLVVGATVREARSDDPSPASKVPLMSITTPGGVITKQENIFFFYDVLLTDKDTYQYPAINGGSLVTVADSNISLSITTVNSMKPGRTITQGGQDVNGQIKYTISGYAIAMPGQGQPNPVKDLWGGTNTIGDALLKDPDVGAEQQVQIIGATPLPSPPVE